jgi:hypothetical protein
MRPPTSNSLWAWLLCTIRDRIRSSTSVGCIVGAQRPVLGAVCTRLFSIAPAFARFAVVTSSGDSSALGEKCVVLKGSHDVHVLGSVRRVVMGQGEVFRRRRRNVENPWKTAADDTAARSAEMVLLGRGLGRVVFVPHDGMLLGILRTQRLLMVLVVQVCDAHIIFSEKESVVLSCLVGRVFLCSSGDWYSKTPGMGSTRSSMCTRGIFS